MEENLKSKLGFLVFTLIVLFIGIGGFFFTRYELNNQKDKKNETKNIDYHIDKDQKYIYYKNLSVISEDAEIEYQDVVINIKGQEALTKSLQDENEIYKTNIKYISKENVTEEVIKYNNDDLYSLNFRVYSDYEYGDYVSLVVKDYDYSCFDFITFNKTKSYIFNTKTGEVLKEADILDKYNLNMDTLKEKMRTFLMGEQRKENEVDVIQIDATINDLKNYSLYINNYGSLYISFLVKTIDGSYNVDMEVKD